MKNKIGFKIIDLSTIKGIKRAEWYKARGWKIESYGFDKIRAINPKTY